MKILVPLVIIIMVLGFGAQLQAAHAAPTTITAYQATIPVNVKAPYQASQWTDAYIFTEPTSGMTFGVKQNGTGWLFLMQWQTSPVYCYDQYCFGGIELGHLNNTQPMGSPTTPTIMILASTAFSSGVDEFIATGEQTPVSVESDGYKTQSTCGLTMSGSTYTAICYRPFKLTDASPYDFPTLGVGSTIEIGFAVGEFSSPGDHSATDMSTYVLTFSGSAYSGSSSTSSSSSSSSTSSSSSHSSSSSSTSSSSTSSSSSSTHSSSSSTSSTSSQTSSSSSSSYAISVETNLASYSGLVNGTISGQITGSSSPSGTVELTITNPSGELVFSDAVSVQSSGSFNDTFHAGVNSLWTSGNYTVTASWNTASTASQFAYTATESSATTTITLTTTSITTSTTTLTSATATETVTQTQTTTQTQTGSSQSIPSWAYAVIFFLIVASLIVGYLARLFLFERRAKYSSE